MLKNMTVEELEQRMKEGAKRLKPAKNLRYVRPRVCAYCKHFMIANGFTGCEREHGIGYDAGDMIHYEMTCDRWTDNK